MNRTRTAARGFAVATAVPLAAALLALRPDPAAADPAPPPIGESFSATAESDVTPGPIGTAAGPINGPGGPVDAPAGLPDTLTGPIAASAGSIDTPTGTTIGTDAAAFVMIVAASFGIARIVEQNLVTVDPGVIEAARSMGAGPLRIIRTLLIPEALGPLVLGYTFVVIAIVDMSAKAGTVGGGGLGDFALVYGYQRFDWQVTLVATLIIISGVQGIQFLGNWLARRVLRR